MSRSCGVTFSFSRPSTKCSVPPRADAHRGRIRSWAAARDDQNLAGCITEISQSGFRIRPTVSGRMTCYTMKPAREWQIEHAPQDQAARTSTMRPDESSDHARSGDEGRGVPRPPAQIRSSLTQTMSPPLIPTEMRTKAKKKMTRTRTRTRMRMRTMTRDEEEEDEPAVGDEALPEAIEEEPRTVLITGACGNIGRKLRDRLGRCLRPGLDRFGR